MKKLGFLACLGFIVLALSGCNSSRSDRDVDSFDDIGETRVFDNPSGTLASGRSRTNGISEESVPAPAPVEAVQSRKLPSARKVEKALSAKKAAKSAPVAARRHMMIGELDMED